MPPLTSSLWNKNFLLIIVANICVFVAFYMLMPIIALYVVEEFKASATVAGIVVSSYIITTLITRPFSGYIVDHYDRKTLYLSMLIIYGILCCGYTLASTIALLIVLRMLLGATFSILSTSGSTLAIDVTPPARRSEGIGYFGAITVLAMAIGPMLGLYIIDKLSYQALFLAAGAACMVGVFFVTMIKTEPRPKVERPKISLDRFYLKEAAPLAVAMILCYFPVGVSVAYLPLYIGECNLDVVSGNYFLFYCIGVMVSRLGSGKLLNKGMQNRLVSIGLVLMVVGYSLFTFFLTPITFVAGSLIIGVSYGLVTPSIQSMIIDLVPHSRRGTANSTYFIALDIGSGSGMLLGGAIATASSYQTLFTIATALVIINLFAYKFILFKKYQKNLAVVKN